MFSLVTFVFAFLCGALNRLRGDNRGTNKWVEKAVYGVIVGVIVGLDVKELPLFALAFSVGLTPGYTDAVGAMLNRRTMKTKTRPKWYSPEIISNPSLSLLLRGVVFAVLPCAALYYYGYDWASFALIASASYIAAAWLQRVIPIPSGEYRKALVFNEHDKPWSWWELWCGWWVGGLSWVTYQVI